MKTEIAWSLSHIFSILNFILTLLFVSYILRRSQKPPGSTLAWLLFVAVVPYLGIPIYVFLSRRKYLVQREKITAEGFEPRPNIIVDFDFTGEEIFSEISGVLRSAQSSIYFSTFIFADDEVGRSIVKILEEKASEGVRVHILLDSLGTFWVKKPSFVKLKSLGGEVRQFMPLFHFSTKERSNFRNHRKIISVDSKKAVIGGVNIAMEYMGPDNNVERWIDFCVSIEGASVYDIEKIFVSDWKVATGNDLELTNFYSNDIKSQNLIQIVPSGPDVKEDALYDSLLTSIYAAKDRIWVASPYFIPDESLSKALELAAKRGLDVRILVPSKSNHVLADLARGSYLKQLSQAGCQILFYPKMLHAKAVVFDSNSAIVGSANFDMRSLRLNFEIGIFLQSPEIIFPVENRFKEMFTEARRPTLSHGYWIELAEGLGRIVGPLI